MQLGAGADGDGLSGAEDHVVRLLRSWTGQYHLPGLTMVNVNVPDKKGPRQVDALVFTPHGLLVLEVKGFTRPQPGVLEVPLNRPWTVDGDPAAVHTLAGLNSGEQVKAGVFAAKNAFATIEGGGDGFVTGLVVLVPQGTGLVVGDTGNAGRGIGVVVATQTELRKTIHRHRRGRREVWSADGVLDVCGALQLTHLAPGRAALLAECFPAELTAPAPTPPAMPAARASAPSRPAAPVAPAARSSSRQGSTTTWLPPARVSPPSPPTRRTPARPAVPAQCTPPPAPQQRRPPPPAPPRRGRRIPWGLIVAVTLILAVGITALVLIGQLFEGR